MSEGPNRRIKMRGNIWGKFPYKVYKLTDNETDALLKEARLIRQFGHPNDEMKFKKELDTNRVWCWKWKKTEHRDFILQKCLTFLEEHNLPRAGGVKLEKLWLNIQSPNEFQPVHVHYSATEHLHVIIFLKSPKAICSTSDMEWEKGQPTLIESKRGSLELFPGGSWDDVKIVKPDPGTMIIMTSTLQHCAYPFKVEGERWSLGATINCADWMQK
jgi:hypothetical protein